MVEMNIFIFLVVDVVDAADVKVELQAKVGMR